MFKHLTRLTVFVALQVSIFLIACWIAVPPPAPGGSILPHEQRLQQRLADRLYREWLRDPEVITRVSSPTEVDPLLMREFMSYRGAEDYYLMSIIDKDQNLQHAPGRRLILLGGSNLAFGMDSQLLEERYGLRPVNLGLCGPLRAGYLLNQARAHARRGDVVVLCFEFKPMFSDTTDSNPELRDRICDILPAMQQYFERPDFAKFESNTFAKWKKYGDKLAFAGFTEQVWDVADRCWQRCSQNPEPALVADNATTDHRRSRFDTEFSAAFPVIASKYGEWIRSETFYSRSAFNEYGDYVGHYGLESDRTFNPCRTTPMPDKVREVMEANIDILNRYAADFRASGVEILFAYPPVCGFGGEFATQYEALVTERLDVPVLFPIADAVTRIDEHYDTDMHLKWEGICRRMQIWTTGLDRHLKPRVAASPADHVAHRNQTVRTALAESANATR